MTAQTPYERFKAFRERKIKAGEPEIRGIYAPRELHDAIRAAAKKLIDKDKKARGLMDL